MTLVTTDVICDLEQDDLPWELGRHLLEIGIKTPYIGHLSTMKKKVGLGLDNSLTPWFPSDTPGIP